MRCHAHRLDRRPLDAPSPTQAFAAAMQPFARPHLDARGIAPAVGSALAARVTAAAAEPGASADAGEGPWQTVKMSSFDKEASGTGRGLCWPSARVATLLRAGLRIPFMPRLVATCRHFAGLAVVEDALIALYRDAVALAGRTVPADQLYPIHFAAGEWR
jgi:hypothetical protein